MGPAPPANRTMEAVSTTPCGSNPTPSSWAHYNVTNSNRMDATSQNTNQANGYDAAGDVTYDGINTYLYDGEGRICAVASPSVNGMTTMTGYLYDADGTRIAKGSIQNMTSCDPAVNGFQLATEHDYIIGSSGEQMTEMAMVSNSMSPVHANAWAGGNLLATYDFVNGGLHFALTDPLGTKRVQVSGTGAPELNCLNLPFGNSPGNPLIADCVPVGASTAEDATEHHFTGKEHDSETGNDYFGARYYASSIERFLSPDPIPWIQWQQGDQDNKNRFENWIANPQNMNIYAYVGNNPLARIDPDGMGWQIVCSVTTTKVTWRPLANSQILNGDPQSTTAITCTSVNSQDPTSAPQRYKPPQGTAPSNPRQQVQAKIHNCVQQGQTAGAQVPSAVPNGQDTIENLGNAAIGLTVGILTAPEAAPLVLLRQAAGGAVTGFSFTGITRSIQRLYTDVSTTQGCLNGGVYNPGSSLIF